MKSGKNWSCCFREEDIKRLGDFIHVNIAKGQGQITSEHKILIATKRVCYFDHTL